MMPCCPCLTRLLRLTALGALLAVLGLACLKPIPTRPPATSNAAQSTAEAPRLAVLLVFDQFRADYLTRWEDLFVAEGFQRLLTEGAWFQNCHYPYALTATGPGHASLLSGCSLNTHGIIDNDWFDRSTRAMVYCASSDRYERVPPGDDTIRSATGKPRKGFGAPTRLQAESLAEVLDRTQKGSARIVSLSLKDRSAILPVGKVPSAQCFWFDTSHGEFVTSTYYRDSLPSWVARFNQDRRADRWFGKEWTRLRQDLGYPPRSGPDDVQGEGNGILFDRPKKLWQGRAFPHPLSAGMQKPAKNYYEALYNSPFASELLLDLVKEAVIAEELGKDDQPDLMSVSFSSNDVVGHCWGPNSQEVLDTTLRTDLLVKDLLAFLDSRVGKGNYVLALTADHGVCPLPEVARAEGKDSGRIKPATLALAAKDFLDLTFGPDPEKASWFDCDPTERIYLNQKMLQRRGLKQPEVEEKLAGWVATQQGIARACTRTQLLQGVPADDAMGQRVLRAFHPERAGDVLVIPKPYWLLTTYLTGTSHGTPHPYDTHVPLLVYGHGVRPGIRQDAVTPQACAAVLAHALRLDRPANAEAPLPEGLFEPLQTSR
jgi:hypothetical protein